MTAMFVCRLCGSLGCQLAVESTKRLSLERRNVAVTELCAKEHSQPVWLAACPAETLYPPGKPLHFVTSDMRLLQRLLRRPLT